MNTEAAYRYESRASMKHNRMIRLRSVLNLTEHNQVHMSGRVPPPAFAHLLIFLCVFFFPSTGELREPLFTPALSSSPLCFMAQINSV